MIRISQFANYVGVQGIHRWRCRFELDGSYDELERVEKVVYTLDSSFPSPVREVSDRESCFALELVCWAAFVLYARVRYKDGDEYLLAEEVKLEPPPDDAEPADPKVLSEGAQGAAPRFEPPPLLTSEADLLLDGGGVRAVAFAGALEAAEEAGLKRFVHVAGSSSGALVAALLAVGYAPSEIGRMLLETGYADLFKWRTTSLVKNVRAGWSNRGLIARKPLRAWLEERFSESRLGTSRPTFGDLAASEQERGPAHSRYRLRLIVSDITAARMVVLPDDIEDYQDDRGNPLVRDEFSLVDAVVMGMCAPFWFRPFVLRRNSVPHYLLDGGLLSNFPIWLFDTAHPARPTWGVRLRARGNEAELGGDQPRHALAFARTLVRAVMEAARELEPTRNETRTLTIPVPAGAVGPRLSETNQRELRDAGYRAGTGFFVSRGTYLNSLGRGLPEDALVAGPAIDLRHRKMASA